MPTGFLFSGGGSISFFGANSGPYMALPTDGTMARSFTGGNNVVNNPENFAGQTGKVVRSRCLDGREQHELVRQRKLDRGCARCHHRHDEHRHSNL